MDSVPSDDPMQTLTGRLLRRVRPELRCNHRPADLSDRLQRRRRRDRPLAQAPGNLSAARKPPRLEPGGSSEERKGIECPVAHQKPTGGWLAVFGWPDEPAAEQRSGSGEAHAVDTGPKRDLGRCVSCGAVWVRRQSIRERERARAEADGGRRSLHTNDQLTPQQPPNSNG